VNDTTHYLREYRYCGLAVREDRGSDGQRIVRLTFKDGAGISATNLDRVIETLAAARRDFFKDAPEADPAPEPDDADAIFGPFSAPTPTPPAPTSQPDASDGDYAVKVGDVVNTTFARLPSMVATVTSPRNDDGQYEVHYHDQPAGKITPGCMGAFYLRPATAAERLAASLPVENDKPAVSS
jgi:hypothetical protein